MMQNHFRKLFRNFIGWVLSGILTNLRKFGICFYFFGANVLGFFAIRVPAVRTTR
ncbi:hypothetical protein FEDK69T_06920 [Flavobacterium enshiense DK69]|nr:hypothetical protein FEDK69T_06920 [Flavobacterium enshiense DK69]